MTLRPQMGPGEVVEVEEVCRILDRLDQLAEQLAGGDYVRMMDERVDDPDVREFRLVVNGALAEARMQAMTLRALLTSLGLEKSVPSEGKKPTETGAGPTPSDGKDVDPADRLAAAREARRRGATSEAG
jgi:hypothetical protein